MTIYQKELERRLSELQCTGEADENSGKLNVQYEGALLCKQDKNGFLTYDSRSFTPAICDKLEEVKEQAAEIREYVGIYENAPPMKIDSLNGYRRLAEYGDTVLGGRYSEQYGFEFATWKQDKGRSYVVHGDYTTDYGYAKNPLPAVPALCRNPIYITGGKQKISMRLLNIPATTAGI